MTEERLFSFSYEQLLEISNRGNIFVTPGVDKETLISLLMDAFEEDRDEREELNNLAIQMEARKFSVSRDEELDLGQDDDLELPLRYNDTSATLLLRDPSWVFCYWDLEDKKVDEIQNSPGFQGLLLRVVELNTKEYSQDNVLDYFDIPIKFNDYRRYINLPSVDTCYCVEIRAVVEDKDYLITRSNSIETTREYVTAPRENDITHSDELIRMSGFSSEFGEAHGVSGYQEIPQRIIPIHDLLDEEQFND
ncbi:DUF4912 domain-containing protein [Oceanispirochaeta crateris]|uniref:DUF4912 domain-containing protein n=1 Tax=Oceanispirochaeta crateris TaxID=2518645 RepID=A0A5C1QP05_9SPIO|nr:DUF4912 domain-containing protein [Oceanispirochaeta crateris]QEN07912.1 DUF4912 domain-containing protein [Oceanispirochaeta crateris]